MSTIEAYYVIVDRTETPVAMGKLETALGNWCARIFWREEGASLHPKRY